MTEESIKLNLDAMIYPEAPDSFEETESGKLILNSTKLQLPGDISFGLSELKSANYEKIEDKHVIKLTTASGNDIYFTICGVTKLKSIAYAESIADSIPNDYSANVPNNSEKPENTEISTVPKPNSNSTQSSPSDSILNDNSTNAPDNNDKPENTENSTIPKPNSDSTQSPPNGGNAKIGGTAKGNANSPNTSTNDKSLNNINKTAGKKTPTSPTSQVIKIILGIVLGIIAIIFILLVIIIIIAVAASSNDKQLTDEAPDASNPIQITESPASAPSQNPSQAVPAPDPVVPEQIPEAQEAAGSSWNIQLHGSVPPSEARQITQLLNQWNDAMNQHNAETVANTHTNNAIIRGKAYTVVAYSDKEAKSFAKHPDFHQSPAIDVYTTPLADKSGYHLIFDHTFIQSGKDTPTEIMLVVIKQGAQYKINYESDIATDLSLLNKMGIKTWTSSSDCLQLIGQITFESPMFRYEYIPQNIAFSKNKSLSIECEDDTCSVYDNGDDEKHYKYDFKSMTMTENNFNYENSIHPKYTSQIRKICKESIDTNAPTAPTPVRPMAAVADEIVIPELIPEPIMITPPEQRLTFKKSLKTKKGTPEYLIFTDKELNTSCYIAVHNYNPKALDDNRYCIPFSGREKDLTHPMAVTKTAAVYENYTYCAAIINPDKGNIPGLAGFFKAFNPNYYASDLARFVDNPFQTHRPEMQYKSGFGDDGTGEGWDKFYRQGPGCEVQKDEWNNIQSVNPACLLHNPFITESEYNLYGLNPGVVFLTASAKKGEKALHQYWQVFDGIPEIVTIETLADGYGIMEFDEKIVQVKDLSSKETYQVLMPQILAGMSVRNRYCEAVNNALINEARAGKWARVDNNSPLMKKK